MEFVKASDLDLEVCEVCAAVKLMLKVMLCHVLFSYVGESPKYSIIRVDQRLKEWEIVMLFIDQASVFQ